MQVCSECQKENLAEARFCNYCGNLLKSILEEEIPEKLQEIYERIKQLIKEASEDASILEWLYRPIRSLNEEFEKCANRHAQLNESYEEFEAMRNMGMDLNDTQKRKYQEVILEINFLKDRAVEINKERFHCASISDMRRELELLLIGLSDRPFQMLKEIVEKYLTPYHSAQMLAPYMPNENICMIKRNQIENVLRSIMHEYTLLLDDLQLIQQQGKNIIPQVQALRKNADGNYWGGIALFIGTLLNFSAADEKSKQVNLQAEHIYRQYEELVDKYCNKLNQSIDFLHENDIVKEFDDYYMKKFIQIIAGGVVDILKQLDSTGVPIYEAKVYFAGDPDLD